ncbi:hypothetical protein K461DRAFT_94159 [Myriangium duriaei CBS 260.36]|uniref:Uncharacterized protein n=1 Tax=Myriangium duriaei CBS 260.36 TaxID=1168546 RepID=A0A9P4JC63_9PEZI|nr:hypothetical protein K461DRAFT_94159 [Myriangium duriaei CBS 260.36]
MQIACVTQLCAFCVAAGYVGLWMNCRQNPRDAQDWSCASVLLLPRGCDCDDLLLN